MGIFSGLFKSRDKPQNSYDSPSYTYFFGRANSGKRVTDRTALQHIAVYACVRVLSEAIAQLPLHMIGDLDHATLSNVEHLSLDFVKYSLDPWIVRWEQSLQKALLSDSEKGQYFVKFNVDGLLRGDYASRMQGYATARQNGWMSANDIRELEDMNMLSDEEGGNLYLVNGSFTKLSEAGKFANQNSEKEEKTK